MKQKRRHLTAEFKARVAEWMSYYNHQRKHQHLGYQTPWSLYEATTALPEVA
jgi:transposase InsO family protein